MNKKIFIAPLLAGISIPLPLAQEASAVSSIIGNFGEGYNAGKQATIDGKSNSCPSSSTSYCAGFQADIRWIDNQLKTSIE